MLKKSTSVPFVQLFILLFFLILSLFILYFFMSSGKKESKPSIKTKLVDGTFTDTVDLSNGTLYFEDLQRTTYNSGLRAPPIGSYTEQWSVKKCMDYIGVDLRTCFEIPKDFELSDGFSNDDSLSIVLNKDGTVYSGIYVTFINEKENVSAICIFANKGNEVEHFSSDFEVLEPTSNIGDHKLGLAYNTIFYDPNKPRAEYYASTFTDKEVNYGICSEAITQKAFINILLSFFENERN